MLQLDGLRACCLISIVIHHWTFKYFHVNFPFEIGAFLFFSLSGYLITRILLRGRKKIHDGRITTVEFLKSFGMRRVLRLLPGYFTALLLYVILLNDDVLENFLWFITNSSNIHFAMEGKFTGGADQFWTLAVDQQFYLLFPFLVLFLPKRFLPVAFILLAALSPLSRYLAYFDNPLFTGSNKDKLPWFIADHLCMGALLAYVQERGKLPKKFFCWILLVTSLLFYLMFRYRWVGFQDSDKILILQQTILAVCSTCLVALCVQGMGGAGKRILEHPVIQYIGKRSYGYYLYHNLAMLFLGKIAWFLYIEIGGKDYLYPLRLIAGAYVLYWMARLSWTYIEQPIMQRKQKHQY